MASLLSIVGVSTARADVVHLRNGHTLEGTIKVVPSNPAELSSGSRWQIWIPGHGPVLIAPWDVLRVERRAALLPPPTTHHTLPGRLTKRRSTHLRWVARTLTKAWRAGDATRARRTLTQEPGALAWDQAKPHIDLTGRYLQHPSGTGGVELKLALRPGVTNPLLVAFPPGTLVRAGGQDLALLRTPVVLLEPGHVARLRVAAAPLTPGGTPVSGATLTLERAPANSGLERLLVTLCANHRDEAACQLALWIHTRNIVPHTLLQQPRVSLTSRELILPLHGERAERLLREAGLDLDDRRFFRDQRLPELPRQPKSDTSCSS